MTPLPVAFPDDAAVYGRENDKTRGYEWMIGPSLLAAPLYGNDYEQATTRDVYLPRGRWIDYDTGEVHDGPKMLRNFSLPVGKTPLFVGGLGIVEEKHGAGSVARVYPMTTTADDFFIDRDGVTRTSIRLQVRDWKNVSVTAKGGRRVAGSWQRHAYEFPIQPGESYEVR
jgi:alpha-glucosidase (family GH31 glycosyl hydrolase)